MSKFFNNCVAVSLLAAAALGCKDGNAAAPPTRGPGMAAAMAATAAAAPASKSTLLGRTTFEAEHKNVDIKRITGDWHIDIKSKPAFDIAVQRILFPVGSSSGWHTHPGPGFIQVVYGTMTVYQADDPRCAPIVRTAGQGYLDLGLHPHVAVNQSSDSAVNIVTYFAPPGATLKMMADVPANCE